MTVARDAAPEIDRLVLSVNRRAMADHGPGLGELARELGLQTLDLLPHLGDFLLAGTLTPELASLRMLYRPPQRVLDRLSELETKQLIDRGESGFAATPRLRPLLEALQAAQATTAAVLWVDHDVDVATATDLALRVGEAASKEHLVAAVHRSMTPPSDRRLELHHRLVTLRYVRQHDHVEAWRSRGLTAAEIVVMTRLWHREPADGGEAELARLGALGYVDGESRLTAGGRRVRDEIEADTNQRSQRTFDVLDEAAAHRLLTALRRLPGTAA